MERERDPLHRERAQRRSSRESWPQEGDRRGEREQDPVDSPSRPTYEWVGRLENATGLQESLPAGQHTSELDGWEMPPGSGRASQPSNQWAGRLEDSVRVSEHKGLPWVLWPRYPNPREGGCSRMASTHRSPPPPPPNEGKRDGGPRENPRDGHPVPPRAVTPLRRRGEWPRGKSKAAGFRSGRRRGLWRRGKEGAWRANNDATKGGARWKLPIASQTNPYMLQGTEIRAVNWSPETRSNWSPESGATGRPHRESICNIPTPRTNVCGS